MTGSRGSRFRLKNDGREGKPVIWYVKYRVIKELSWHCKQWWKSLDWCTGKENWVNANVRIMDIHPLYLWGKWVGMWLEERERLMLSITEWTDWIDFKFKCYVDQGKEL